MFPYPLKGLKTRLSQAQMPLYTPQNLRQVALFKPSPP